jgi:hypothetical protein
MDKKKLSLIALMLLFSFLNYSRIEGIENIRPIEFLSIFTIGALSGVLIYGIVNFLKNKK